MGLIQLRRWEDDILLCNNCTDMSPMAWRFIKPVNTTITGVQVPRTGKTMSRFWTATFEFASDDPVNTFARYDRLAYDAMLDDVLNPVFFRFIDLDGTRYKCRIMASTEEERMKLPLDTVISVTCQFKQDGHIR